jgi:translation initiation factor IF-1
VDTPSNKAPVNSGSSSRGGKPEAVEATVTETLPNTLFRVKFADSDEEKLAYLAGKMRLNHIRVIIGDRVLVELEPYGGKGRIIKRL